jgi:peptidoglycan/xylan/chitin deacetylase (PgdA/CDA1 family)
MRHMGRTEREDLLAGLERDTGVDPPRDRMLSWSDLREMRCQGWEVGAHTYSHPCLALINEQEARWEMQRSRDDLHSYLGMQNAAFCFPNGSYNQGLVTIVKELGFRSAFQKYKGLAINHLDGTHQFGLARMALPNASGRSLEVRLDSPLNVLAQAFGDRNALRENQSASAAPGGLIPTE